MQVNVIINTAMFVVAAIDDAKQQDILYFHYGQILPIIYQVV